MNPALLKMYAMLLGLLGPQPGEPWINMPAELSLKQREQTIAIGDSITRAGSANMLLRIYIEAGKQIARERKCALVDLHQLFMTVLSKRPSDVKNKTVL
jgi:hypothetical protein